MTHTVEHWIENAAAGIAKRRPGFVLKSGTELKAMGEIDHAKQLLRRAASDKAFFDQIDSQSQDKILTLLCSLLKDDEPDEILKIAESLPVKGSGVLLMQATALGRLDRHAEGIALLEAEVKSGPSPPKFDVAYKLAGLNMQIGREEDAVRLLEPLVNGGPFEAYTPMRQMLASAYIKTRRPDKASALLGKSTDNQSRDLVKKADGVTGPREKKPSGRPRVFVIYGHDFSYRFLELVLHRIGADPLVFEQLPKTGGATVIELLEQYIPSADAVIALLTPDDEGRKKGTDTWEPRARQNVLIEAGYAVISRRSRSVIVALGGVSIPSDFEGIHRIQESEWSATVGMKVAKRLLDMGLNVDLSATA